MPEPNTRPALRIIHGIRQRPLDGEAAARVKAGIRALAQEVPTLAPVLPHLLDEIDRETTQTDRWDFTMMNPTQLAIAIRLIRTEAKRPMLSFAVWEVIIQNLDRSTGAVTLTREQIAERIGKPVNRISAVMSELVAWNILRRFQNGRAAFWMFNPNIGTRLPGAAGEAARKAAGPVLAYSREGRVEDPAQPELLPEGGER